MTIEMGHFVVGGLLVAMGFCLGAYWAERVRARELKWWAEYEAKADYRDCGPAPHDLGPAGSGPPGPRVNDRDYFAGAPEPPAPPPTRPPDDEDDGYDDLREGEYWKFGKRPYWDREEDE